jgi:hypothetical protein
MHLERTSSTPMFSALLTLPPPAVLEDAAEARAYRARADALLSV